MSNGEKRIMYLTAWVTLANSVILLIHAAITANQ